MSTNKTKNYQLHAWEPGDDFLLAEINENFAALDDGVRMATGTYEGVSSKTNEDIVSSIDLGFTPKAVFISRQRSDHPDCLILITQSETKNMYLRIVEGGFRHICNNGYTAYGGTYHFIAFA